jgi:hypothetical protein
VYHAELDVVMPLAVCYQSLVSHVISHILSRWFQLFGGKQRPNIQPPPAAVEELQSYSLFLLREGVSPMQLLRDRVLSSCELEEQVYLQF